MTTRSRMPTLCTISLAIANLLIACGPRTDPQPADLLITNVTIVDVESGSLRPSIDIVVADGRIQAIGKGSNRELAKNTLEGRGLFALPGLWDMHVHTAAREVFFPLYIAHGVTGVRDMGGDHDRGTGNFSISLDSLAEWRDAIQRDEIYGPRLVITGPLIDGPEPVYPGLSYPVHTEDEARELVRSIAARGADFIKVYSALPRDLYEVIADESRLQGLPFVGHVPRAVTAVEAARLGQKSMEHLRQMIEHYDENSVQELLQVLVENKSWQTPTLAVYRDLKRGDGLEFMDDPRMQYIPSYIRERWAESPWWHAPRTNAEKIQQLEEWKARHAMVKRMHNAGVPLLAGSDSANPYTYPGSGLHDELEELVAAGLAPVEALRTATTAPAKYLEAEDSLGSIAVGKVADLVLLSANPLEDIQNTRQIEAVVACKQLLLAQWVMQHIEQLVRP